MTFERVEGNKSLFRNTSNGSVINSNKSEYQAYIQNRDRLLSDKERIDSLEKKVDNMKGDLDEIKSMLRSVING
jgi:hypothetical protein